ncbi:hypothetical protein RD792_013485 [Penstemon davidsonii]|uniref:RRM domain-containing protein n=1 Tax=Penstemon davidsonii TaxID=160366 RepID=A0ABR0CTN3_9LAMI|nr:hypothetical protein RD792_013485 [Penstemon davidsonii]
MEALLSTTFSAKIPHLIKTTPHSLLYAVSCFSSSISTLNSDKSSRNRQWMVLVEPPPQKLATKPQIIDYYVTTLETVLGSEKDAQMCMYDASCDTHFGFCCDIDEDIALQLAGMPGVLSIKPDPNSDSVQRDYNLSKIELNPQSSQLSWLFPARTTKHWVVRMGRPSVGVMRKASVVDYYVQVLMRVLGNEKDAQMCMYHISWQSNYGFCCVLDDECARELSDIPGVLSVLPDENLDSDDKDYGGENVRQSKASEDPSASTHTSSIKTKKLFITGLSFYTSEKTLRAAFEGFGEIVEVKIIMDKISKRSKGYAFVEYTTEEAASVALKEMNGKIINGWMITVDVAKKNPPKYSRGQPRPTS